MPSEVYLMWHKYPWIFGHTACDAKIVITEGITYAGVATLIACSLEGGLNLFSVDNLNFFNT
jgi:neuromedin U receptor 1